MKIANKTLLLFLVYILIISAASADGWHLSDRQLHLLEPNQKAVISWDGKNETMILSSAVKSDEIANFAWIIPIQSSTKPEVTAGNISVFEDLVEYFKKEEPQGRVVIAAVIPGVEVLESKEIDVYDITILKATRADDLISWLNNNGYKVPEEAKPILDKYVAKGDYYFIANKIDLTNRFKEETISRYNWLMKSRFDESFGILAQKDLLDTYKFPLFKKMLSYNILCNQDFSLKSRYFPEFFDSAKNSNLEKLGISNSKYFELNTIYGITPRIEYTFLQKIWNWISDLIGIQPEKQPKADDGFCKSLLEVKKNYSYLFTWEEIPGNDTGRFVEFLKKEYGAYYYWLDKAKIEKIDNGRKINFSEGNNFLSLELDDFFGEVILTRESGYSWKYIAVKNGKINVYEYSDFDPPYVNHTGLYKLYPPYDEVPFPNENIKNRYNMIYKEISLLLDPIQESHFLMSDLRKGMSTPLKFEFQPHQPYYPLEISSLNSGESIIEVYVLTNSSVTDRSELLELDEVKEINTDLRRKLERYINLSQAEYVTRLFYKGNLKELVDDAEFGTEKQIAIEDSEKNKTVMLDRIVSEKPILNISSWDPYFPLKISPNNRRVAYTGYGKNGQFFIVDGKEQPKYFGGDFIFSPDSKRVAYVAMEDNKQFIVVDGKEMKKYNGFVGSLLFSPDSKRLAYRAQVGDNMFAVVDEKEEKQYPHIEPIIFSPDSKRVAYTANDGKNAILVLDGKDVAKNDGGMSYPIFSPDSKRVAYVVWEDNKQFVVVDGKEEKQYESWNPVFSPDSKRVAYIAKEGEKMFLVVDGKKEKSYNLIVLGPVFSPDSKRLAYVAMEDNKQFVVADGKEMNKYYGLVELPIFSPDSKRLSYKARVYDMEFAVVDGKEEKQYRVVSQIIFSLDSKQVAYIARFRNSWLVVRNGKEKEHYSGIYSNTLNFTPDSNRLAYKARLGNKWFVVVNGNEGKEYEIAFPSITERLSWEDRKIIFDSSDSFQYLAINNSDIYLVEEVIK